MLFFFSQIPKKNFFPRCSSKDLENYDYKQNKDGRAARALAKVCLGGEAACCYSQLFDVSLFCRRKPLKKLLKTTKHLSLSRLLLPFLRIKIIICQNVIFLVGTFRCWLL